MSRWTVHSERVAYASPWVNVFLADVVTSTGRRVPEHHVVRINAATAGCVVFDARTDSILLLWRHRFITDQWGYEIPAGRVEAGESPEQAALRETVEETGWMPTALRPLLRYHPSPGLSDQLFHVFVAEPSHRIGDPADADEAERVEWVPVPALVEALDKDLSNGIALIALLTWLRQEGR